MLSINLVTLESYQTAPTSGLDATFSEFRGAEVKQVPVIRIFGSTSTGIKTCLHIHGVFPYMYVPCTIEENVDSFMYRLATAIDSAINVSLGYTLSNKQHVYKIQRVSGIPFYGFHEKEHWFFKIYFYNPAMIKRAADLLQNGTILNQGLQPHEAHIPYILQFMIDYNLYGMSSINITNIKYRQHNRGSTTPKENSQHSDSSNLSDSQNYLPLSVICQSICELEVDAQASNILNREEIEKGLELNPGIAAIWNDENSRRDAKGLQHAESQLLYSKPLQNRVHFPTDNDVYQEKRLAQRLQTISQTNDSTMPLSSGLSYPLEVENEAKSFNASHVLNHLESSTSQSKVQLEKSELVGENITSDKVAETSMLDIEDMHLVEMLANLAEANDEDKIVDDDSVLASQYSMLSDQIKDDNDDDEVEDLNITSLDLDSLSSWNSVPGAASQSEVVEIGNQNKVHNSKELPNMLNDHFEETSVLNFPQYDGVHDLEREPLTVKVQNRSKVRSHSSKTERVICMFFKRNLITKQFNFLNFQKCMDFLNGLVALEQYSKTDVLDVKKKMYQMVCECYSSRFITSNTIFFHNNSSHHAVCTKIFTTQTPEFKNKLKGCKQFVKADKMLPYLRYNRNMLNLCRLDHRDLDVYDTDITNQAPLLTTGIDLKRYVSLSNENSQSSIDLTSIQQLSIKLKIPAFDGDTVESSSDSEMDHDLTIDRQEKRICSYKSCTKLTAGYVINTTPTKRKHDFESFSGESPQKRRNVDSATIQQQTHRTPTKTRTPRSPQCSSGKYAPLNITVISPKGSKHNVERHYTSKSIPSSPKSDSTSICTTPKQKNHQLRIRLLREKSHALSPRIIYENVDEDNDNTEEKSQFSEEANIQENEHRINECIKTDSESTDIETNLCNLTQTSSKKSSVSKANKEVCKRLSFISKDDKETDVVKNDRDSEHYSEHSPLAEYVNQLDEEDDLLNMSKINPHTHENFMSVSETITKLNSKQNVSYTSMHDVNKDDADNHSTKVSEETNYGSEFEDEEDACNMTFTQYLSKKLEVDNQSFMSLEANSNTAVKELITITTKYNPPSRKRIIDSMKMYNILEYKSSAPFFSNKMDLAKQKENSNKNSDISDVIPFKSSLDNLTGIKVWRRVKVNEFHPSGATIKSCDIKRVLAGYNSLVIQPLVHPPTTKNVKTWLQAKEYLLKKCKKLKEKKNSSPATFDVEGKEQHVLNLKCDKIAGKHSETVSEASTNCLKVLDADCKELHTEYVGQNTVDEKSSNTGETNYLKDHSQNSSKSNESLNPSLQRILENPLFLKNDDTQQHLGISYGQIDYSIKRDAGNATNENFQNARGSIVYQYLTILSLEVHVVTRADLLPDPEQDSIEALFYAIHNDVPVSSNTEQMEHGAVIINTSVNNLKLKHMLSTSLNCPISFVASEEDLLNSLVTLIRHCNPDILLGWEIESLSWGYIFQRASHLGINNFNWKISRTPNAAPASKAQSSDKDNLNEAKVPGRIILDVWRIMRHEAALLNYTFENVMYHIMHERISCPTFKALTDWWKHINLMVKGKVVTHYVTRVVGTLRILMQLDIIGRTCEHARLFGIQFYEVFSRGSQFRVESMMLRLAKPLNFIPISPSVQQRARMRAPESLPLIMEPQSILYTDPLIVLDFQSLYPSIIIAYNYCFSTCLGRIEHIGHYEPFEFGAASLRLKKSTALKLQGKINFAPCGVAYVKSDVRQGILPRMLEEILNTRLMVKESMKLHNNESRALQRVLHSQQLGLKLIANVTYGYTAANFSGRMPCIEIGDSVVSKGRETLERAIKIVESTPKWGAQVVYGDTDSLFVLLPGKRREEAFRIGAEIADVVTAANPSPVKLKFEKVLQPSILQTKKRYCGYMYEYPEQTEPEYLAKGIETVRRDGCPAVAKVLEKSLKILFDTKDISLVKKYVTRQFDKILRRKISIQDLTFAKEFRGLRGYKASASVPALELTRRLMRKDPRAVPRTGERVRYVVVAGAPNQALIHCIRTPMEVILDEGLSPNAIYYITKVIIPPLNRCFNLIGIDINMWYREMSHRQTPDKVVSLVTDSHKSTIRQFFSTVVCASCGVLTKKEICESCISRPNQTVTILHEKLRWLERTYAELIMICQSCTGCLEDPKCESLDCPVLYRMAQARRDLVQIPYLNSIIHENSNNNIARNNEHTW